MSKSPVDGTYEKFDYTAHDKARSSCEEHKATDPRSAFERDRSRIIHSAAFRRLQGKTQVFTLGESDFYRTRLTHSLEVAQIGKGLALRLGADVDLVEAICLIHDIGHPPFGHAGESELKDLMQCHGGFEANAQNIRLFTLLERKHQAYKGLNLTRAVIDGQLKYKTSFSHKEKKFVYADDAHLVKWASSEAQCIVADDQASEKSFECQIMDLADDIAYAVHDLEDGIRARYIDASTFRKEDPRVKTAIKQTEKEMDERHQNHHESVGSIFQRLKQDLRKLNPSLWPSEEYVEHTKRRTDRKQMTSALIGRYIGAAQRNQKQTCESNPVSHRYLYDVDIPLEFEIELSLLKNILVNCVFRAPQLLILEQKGRHIIRRLFDELIDHPEFLPDDWLEAFPNLTDEHDKARTVCDYISGMTDNYAQQMYSRIFVPHAGSISEIY